jgi:hypothetical protein
MADDQTEAGGPTDVAEIELAPPAEEAAMHEEAPE